MTDVPLTATDPLPFRPRRILVTGCSGSGKTTLAAALATRLGLPHHELDALFHGPAWVPRPTFVADVTALAATECWVVEWQYSHVRPLLLARAELLVWLDLSRTRVFAQLLRRTVVRRLRGVELWNGNYEPPLRTLFTDRDHIIRWSWRTHRQRERDALAVARQVNGPNVVRLVGQAQVDAWVRGPLRALASSR